MLTAEPEIAAAAAEQPAARSRSRTTSNAGKTASRIGDYRELFKVRVTLMVVMTAWAGFYLGSMQSGISSVQPGLIEALFGIALVSAGSAALNECLERKLDAKMIRTSQRPMVTGRIGLAHGIVAGLLCIAIGSIFLG